MSTLSSCEPVRGRASRCSTIVQQLVTGVGGVLMLLSPVVLCLAAGRWNWQAGVRHPLYTAMLGIAIAFALVTAHWVFVTFGIVSVGGLFSRVPRGDQIMLDQFGSEYAAYTQRTGRFFPRFSRPGR